MFTEQAIPFEAPWQPTVDNAIVEARLPMDSATRSHRVVAMFGFGGAVLPLALLATVTPFGAHFWSSALALVALGGLGTRAAILAMRASKRSIVLRIDRERDRIWILHVEARGEQVIEEERASSARVVICSVILFFGHLLRPYRGVAAILVCGDASVAIAVRESDASIEEYVSRSIGQCVPVERDLDRVIEGEANRRLIG